MIPLTNADYYAPEPPTIRTDTPEPISFDELGKMRRAIDRGYRQFMRSRGLIPAPGPFFFRNHKKTT